MSAKYPRPLTDEESEQVRHCLHSHIAGCSKNLMPDYVCSARSGKLCMLYNYSNCHKYEPYAGHR